MQFHQAFARRRVPPDTWKPIRFKEQLWRAPPVPPLPRAHFWSAWNQNQSRPLHDKPKKPFGCGGHRFQKAIGIKPSSVDPAAANTRKSASTSYVGGQGFSKIPRRGGGPTTTGSDEYDMLLRLQIGRTKTSHQSCGYDEALVLSEFTSALRAIETLPGSLALRPPTS